MTDEDEVVAEKVTDAERAEATKKLTMALTFLDLACAQASVTGHKRVFLAVCGGFEDGTGTQVAVLPNVHEFFTDIARVMGYATINDLLLAEEEEEDEETQAKFDSSAFFGVDCETTGV